jgi:hypothetical protein
MDTQPPVQAISRQEIVFPNGNRAQVVMPPLGAKAADILVALGLKQPKALIMLTGGAAGLDQAPEPRLSLSFNRRRKALKSRLLQLFSQGLARAAVDTGALIIDGGTKSGVMELIGQGVAEWEPKPTLLGVAPAGKITYPGGPAADSIPDGAPLDPNHSYFVMVDSQEWGGETRTMYELAKALANRVLASPVPGGNGLTGQDLTAKNISGVTMLVNGGPIAKDEVLRSVRQGWPIIVIEGSGRLADEIARLWRQKRRIETRRPVNRWNFSGRIAGWWQKNKLVIDDPALAEIIDDGQIHLFPLDSPVAELRHLIQSQLRQWQRDPTLQDAWRRFALYDQNAITAQKHFLRLRKWILTLGVVATTLAVLHSTLDPIETLWAAQVNFFLNFLVIGAPILVSFLLAGWVKFERGISWVLLRGSAEAIKKEIYRYRAQVEIYSSEKTDETEPREIKLARKIKMIGERLMKTQVNRIGLIPYEGKLPPVYGAAKGDDGFSKLSPEEYLARRLEDQLNWYQGKTVDLDKQLQWLQWSIYILGGVGTFLAAIGYQIWIAVTLAVVGALTSFLEFKRVETTLMAYNQAATDLDSIRTWWHALPDKDKNEDNFEKLVTNTEAVIETEHAGWVQELGDALAELYGEKKTPGETTES